MKNLLPNNEYTIAILNTKPFSICELSKIRKCKKVSGKIYVGNNRNREWFGYKLRLIIDTYEQLISFNIMQVSKHDINALKELKTEQTTADLLNRKILITDRAFTSKQLKEELKDLNIELQAIKKGKFTINKEKNNFFLRKVRKKIEIAFSRLKYMEIENIRAVSFEGFLTKIHFFILALQFKIIFKVLIRN